MGKKLSTISYSCNVYSIIIVGLDIFYSTIPACTTKTLKNTDTGCCRLLLYLLFFAERCVRAGDREEAAYLKNTRKTLSCVNTVYSVTYCQSRVEHYNRFILLLCFRPVTQTNGWAHARGREKVCGSGSYDAAEELVLGRAADFTRRSLRGHAYGGERFPAFGQIDQTKAFPKHAP